MKLFRRGISIVLALAVSVMLLPGYSVADSISDEMRAFIVNTLDNRDFPSKSNLSVGHLRKEINEMLSFCKLNDFNSIIFEARPDDGALYKTPHYPTSDFWQKNKGDFTFYDVSKDLINCAQKEGIDVYALINPGFEDGVTEKAIELNLKDISRLSKRFGFKGVVIEKLPVEEDFDYSQFLIDIKAVLDGKPLGVMCSPTLFSEESSKAVLEEADFVIPKLESSLGFRNNDGYIKELKDLREVNENIVPVSTVYETEDVTPVLSTKHFEALNEGFRSFVLDGYRALKENRNMQMSLISTVSDMSDYVSNMDTGYKPVHEFNITRPAKNISTPYSTYFIFGTSDPDSALYFRGQKLQREGEDGLWGVQVKLGVGNNYFTFAQGGVSKSVVIRRTSSQGGTPSLISKITKAFPWDNAVFRNGEERVVSCIAPSGGRVIAEVMGQKIELDQAAAAQRGVPALYKGTITLDGASIEEVKSIGTIDYHLTFNGVNSTYTTKGEVYLAGEDAKPLVKTDILFANVLTPELEFGDFKAIYKEGTIDEAVGMEYANNDWYYELKNGGFIKAADVEVLESEENRPVADILDLSLEKDGNKEFIRFKDAEGLPYSFTDNEDGSSDLELYGYFGSDEEEALNHFLNDNPSEHFSFIEAEVMSYGIKLHFVPYEKDDIWGLDVIYDGSDTLIMSREKPEISDDVNKPLSNLTVAIDPGHGKNDSGAPGLFGIYGPMEKDVNLLNSLLLKERLEKLGAEVVLTRYDDNENPSLLERENISYANDADIFMSLHHNSIAEAADGNKFSGVEAYYYENFGRELAELIPKKISENNYDRDLRQTTTAYYVVTKVRSAPALLAEIGFMPSPYEYEKVCDTDEIFKTAEAITASILEFMQ